MRYAMKAHPTEYRGVEYDSRLEATWAAFFDLAGWTHHYQPVDLEGWSPDFSIQTAEDPILVEVKPIEPVKRPWPKSSVFDAATERRMVLAAGERHNLLLLGLRPPGTVENANYEHALPELGAFYDPFDCGAWETAVLIAPAGAWDIDISGCGVFGPRIAEGRGIGGDHHCHGVDSAMAQSAWSQAKNATKYRPSKRAGV